MKRSLTLFSLLLVGSWSFVYGVLCVQAQQVIRAEHFEYSAAIWNDDKHKLTIALYGEKPSEGTITLLRETGMFGGADVVIFVSFVEGTRSLNLSSALSYGHFVNFYFTNFSFGKNGYLKKPPVKVGSAFLTPNRRGFKHELLKVSGNIALNKPVRVHHVGTSNNSNWDIDVSAQFVFIGK